MPDQELNTATATYWEGAVTFQGTRQRHSPARVWLRGYASISTFSAYALNLSYSCRMAVMFIRPQSWVESS